MYQKKKKTKRNFIYKIYTIFERQKFKSIFSILKSNSIKREKAKVLYFSFLNFKKKENDQKKVIKIVRNKIQFYIFIIGSIFTKLKSASRYF